MLIFDSFPDEAKAREFMKAVTKKFKVRSYYCHHNEKGFLYEEGTTLQKNPISTATFPMTPIGVLDTYPFKTTPPVVCVERSDDSDEPVIDMVLKFRGSFSGT